MTISGQIAAAARSELPKTWDALLASPSVGEAMMQLRLDWVKFRLFSTVVDPSIEMSYGPSAVMLAAKYVALAMIPPAIDYWGRQMVSESLSGANETKTYTDTRDGLYKIQARLLAEIPELEAEVAVALGVRARRVGRGPKVSPGGFVTADPLTFPKYGRRRYPNDADPFYPFNKVTP